MNARAGSRAIDSGSETRDAALSIVAPTAPNPATPDFDRLAPFYRWMEWLSFGPFLHRCRCAYLREMRGRRRALVLGDGDGRFTARLLKTGPDLRVDAIDASPAMLRALLRRSGPHAARVRPTCIDARQWRPAPRAQYSLIVTHFFLDCLSTGEVRSLAARLRSAAAPGVMWVVSEFAIPKNVCGRLLAAPLVNALYWAFGRLTGLIQRRLPGYASALRDAGFELTRRKTRLGGLLVSEIWTAGRNCYNHVKIENSGAPSSAPRRTDRR